MSSKQLWGLRATASYFIRRYFKDEKSKVGYGVRGSSGNVGGRSDRATERRRARWRNAAG